MWFTRQDSGFRGWFIVKQGNGTLYVDLTDSVFTATVRDPQDLTGSTFPVTQSGKQGLYRFDINAPFLSASGLGEYGVVVEVNAAGPKVNDAMSEVFRVTQNDLDSITGSIAGEVWDELASSHNVSGTMGYLMNQSEQILSSTVGGVALTSASITDIVDGVWDEPLAEHGISGSTGDYAQRAAYNDIVYFDSNVGTTGTRFPQGTKSFPINNEADLRTVADKYNFTAYAVRGLLTLTQSHAQFTFMGRGDGDTVDVNGKTVSSARFSGLTVSGTFQGGGNYVIDRGVLDDVRNFRGFAIETGLKNTIQLGSGPTSFHQCYSKAPGQFETPALDIDGQSGVTFNVRAYSGGLTVLSMSNANNRGTTEFIAGQLVIDSSNSDGELAIRGTTQVTNNGTGIATSSIAHLSRRTITDSVWNEPNDAHFISGSTGDSLYSGSVAAVGDISVSASVDVNSIVSGVWDAGASGFNTSGSMGYLMNQVSIISGSVDLIRDMTAGRWKIDTALNQMIFYKEDNTTEVARFDLTDASGSPTSDSPYERTKT
jgi:hypothetical protein